MEKRFKVKASVMLVLLAIAGLANATVVLEDNFSDDPSYGQPSNPPWNVAVTPSGQVNRVDPDAGNYFGEGTTNKVLRMRLTSGTGQMVRGIRNYATGASAVSLKFDFVDTSESYTPTPLRLIIGGNGWATNYWQAFDFKRDAYNSTTGKIYAWSGTTSTLLGSYTTGGTKQTIEIVANGNTSGTVYYGDSQSVAANKFDLWINGVKVADDFDKQWGNLVSPGDFQEVEFQMPAFTTGNIKEFYFDNFVATAIPEPATMSILALGSMALALHRKK